MQSDSAQATTTASFDWTDSALGAPAAWPHHLRLCVDLLLNSPLAQALMWGPEQILVYNEAYVALLGAERMAAPGGRVPAMLPPEWGWSGAALAAVWAGKAARHRRQPLQIWRGGGATELLLDLYYTPVCDETGQVRGVLCALAPSSAPAAAPDRALRVLVVEDNPDARFLVCEMLHTFGHQVRAVGGAEEALQILAGGDIEVLFTDVGLPGMSGVELARHALRGQPGLHIIFASGFGDTLTRHIEFAATSLQKPYDMAQLRRALDAVDAGPDGAAPPD
ncbi:response regulator [Rugamonas sp.]|uniref:response regulator n=1 Tax=Rugamonas sp. TaxID=1926287 RepID=UPI0025CBC926|nr:response regulator [Rugamonas sp.]